MTGHVRQPFKVGDLVRFEDIDPLVPPGVPAGTYQGLSLIGDPMRWLADQGFTDAADTVAVFQRQLARPWRHPVPWVLLRLPESDRFPHGADLLIPSGYLQVVGHGHLDTPAPVGLN